jgi:hypothetical protein
MEFLISLVGGPLLKLVGSLAVAALTPVLIKLLGKLTGKILDESQQTQVKQIVQGVEEYAVALAMGKIAGKAPCKLTSVEKYQMALKQAEKQLGVKPEQASAQVDRALGSLPNVGANTWAPIEQPLVTGA